MSGAGESISELKERARTIFGPKFGGLFQEAPSISFPDFEYNVQLEHGAHAIGALLAVSGHQKGHFDKNETMSAIQSADEVHDLLAIEGQEHIQNSRVIRCDVLALQDGAVLTIDGGTSAGLLPSENLVVIAARKVVVRTPTSGAGIVVSPGPKAPKPSTPSKAADGINGTGVGESGTDGTHGTHGTSSRPDQPRIMRQFVIAFDEIEVTDPNDPEQNYPALTFETHGQDGRDGGDGGDGGHGGNGAQGSSSVTKAHLLVDLHCAAGPGRGGDGGDGGRAGRGGDAEDGIQGGNLILMSTAAGISKMLAFQFLATPGKPGTGGSRGKPGNFGWHGAEGNVNWPCTHAGRDGVKGLIGDKARNGADGAKNEHQGRIYLELLTQAEFDSMWP